jgi:hypothetical protein
LAANRAVLSSIPSAKGAPRSCPAGLVAEVGLRWWRRDAAMNRTEDLNVKVCEEANGYIIGDVWSCREARRPDRCRFREQEGRSWLEAISRHRDAEVTHWGTPPQLPRHLLFRILAYRLQADQLGDLDANTRRVLNRMGFETADGIGRLVADLNRSRTELRPGTLLTREWDGHLQRVMVLADGFSWNGETYRSLSKVAFAMTGTRWSGPRFFGLDQPPSERRP